MHFTASTRSSFTQLFKVKQLFIQFSINSFNSFYFHLLIENFNWFNWKIWKSNWVLWKLAEFSQVLEVLNLVNNNSVPAFLSKCKQSVGVCQAKIISRNFSKFFFNRLQIPPKFKSLCQLALAADGEGLNIVSIEFWKDEQKV